MEPASSSIRDIFQHVIARCLNASEHEVVFAFIEESDLNEFIIYSINEIETIVQDLQINSNLKVDKVKTIAYSFLKQFNEQLALIYDAEKKQRLKKLLAKIAKGIMLEVQQQAPAYAIQIKKAIQQGLEQAVYVEEYNQKDFENYFQLNYTDISNSEVTITSVPETIEFFTWDHQKADLNKLVSTLQNDYFCIKSKTEFHFLFDYPPKKNLIRWDIQQTDLLILLIRHLYDEKIIRLKGGKGLWKVILNRFVDFDKNPLDIDPAKRLNALKTLKMTKPSLEENLRQIDNYIRPKK